MQKLDTTKLKVHASAINSIDHKYYLFNSIIDSNNEQVSTIMQLNRSNKVHGIKDVRLINNEILVIELSAKVLSDNYLKGISINTIEQALAQFNKVGIDLNINDAIEESTILSCDITSGLYMGESEFNKYKIGVQASIIHPKIKVVPYSQKGNNGIEFRGTWRTKKERLINYSKEYEMRLTSENKAFIASCTNPNELVHQFKNLRRVEMNLRGLGEIRRHLEIPYKGEPKTIDVLSSNKKVAYDMLSKYMQCDISKLSRIDQNNNMSTAEKAKFIGYAQIIKDLNHDEKLIIEWLKNDNGKNWDKYWHGRGEQLGIKHILQNILDASLSKPQSETMSSINEFMTKLKDAI